MTREEKMKAIVDMSMEMMILTEAPDDELDKLYIQTKIAYNTLKETLKELEDSND